MTGLNRWVLLAALVLAAPACASPVVDCPQAQNALVVAAFASAPEVTARISEMEKKGWVAGSDYAVMTAGSCGVAGCNQTWLAGRLMTRTPGKANPQTVSVQARVVVNQTRNQVLSVELISAE